MNVKFRLRRDTAANWATANPILASGEPGFVTDTSDLKIGDGVTEWVSLRTVATSADVTALIAQIDSVDTDLTQDIADLTANLNADGGAVHKDALPVNVKDFGATGDGVTDDTAAIHAARDAGAASNRDIYFGPGDFLSPGLTANVPGQTWLLDKATTIVLDPADTNHAITVAASGVAIRGGGKIAAGTATHACIFINAGISDVDMDGMELEGGTYGVRVKGGTGAVTTRVSVVDCYVHNQVSHGVYFNWETEDSRISGCNIASPGGNGIWVGNNSLRPKITDNIITSSGRIGIEVFNGSGDALVSGNTVNICSSIGISLDRADRSQVALNTIISSGSYGLELAGSNACAVLGNTVRLAGSVGVSISALGVGTSCDDNLIQGNYFYNPAGNGIYAGGSSQGAKRMRIIGNYVVDAGNGASGFVAIGNATGIGCTDAVIANNIVRWTITSTSCSGINPNMPNATITGNQIIHDAGQVTGGGTGINLPSTALDCTVVGNTIEGAGKCSNGIVMSSSCTGVLVAGNKITGTTSNLIQNNSASATNHIANNLCTRSGGAGITAGGATLSGNRDTASAFSVNAGGSRFDGNVGFFATTPVAQQTGVSPGKALENFGLATALSRTFNVKDFGAVGNGTTNDAAAIQAAIDAASAVATGATVEFPPGFYKINTGLTLTAPNVRLVGLGGPGHMGISGSFSGRSYATAVIHSDTAGLVLLTIGTTATTDWRGPTIENLTFNDSSAGNSTIAGAILVQRMNNGVIRNCGFNRISAGYGIKTNATSGNPQYWTIERANMLACLTGIDMRSPSSDWVIRDCVIWGAGSSGPGVVAGSFGMRLNGTAKVFGTSVQYNDIEIEVGGDHNQLIGCTIEAAGANTAPAPSVGVDVISGANNVVDVEAANTHLYTVNPVRIAAAATGTVVRNYRATGAPAVPIADSGVNTSHTSLPAGNKFAGNMGFYGTPPIAKPTVTGSRSGNAALASLLTQLAALGLVTDSSTA
jgi:hypothetical protein